MLTITHCMGQRRRLNSPLGLPNFGMVLAEVARIAERFEAVFGSKQLRGLSVPFFPRN